MKKSILLITAIASFTTNANQSLREDAILIEDDAMKMAAGFYPDEVVYMLPDSSYKPEVEPQNFRGGTTTVTQGYMGVEARGRESSFTYETPFGRGGIYRTGGDSFADMNMEIPNGNEFTFVRVWGNDTNVGEDLTFFVVERCLPAFSAGPIATTQLATETVDTSAGDFSAFIAIPADTFINTQDCTYTTRTRFNTADDSLQLFKIRAQSESVL